MLRAFSVAAVFVVSAFPLGLSAQEITAKQLLKGLPLGSYSIQSPQADDIYLVREPGTALEVVDLSGIAKQTWLLENKAVNSPLISIPDLGSVSYRKSAKAEEQNYPGTPIYHVWTPAVDTAPTFAKVVGISKQPTDIYFDGVNVMNLDKYVDQATIDTKWRLISAEDQADVVLSLLRSFDIPSTSVDQLAFSSVGANGTHVFDVDTRGLTDIQRSQLASISPKTATGTRPNWKPETYSAIVTFPDGAIPPDLVNDGLASLLAEHVLSIGIAEIFDPEGQGAYSSDVLFHLSGVQRDARDKFGVGSRDDQLWLYNVVQLLFFVDNGKQKAQFDLTTLKCRRGPPDAPHPQEGSMGDNCAANSVTPGSVGQMLLSPIIEAFRGTITLAL